MTQTVDRPYPTIDSHVDLIHDLMRRHEGARFSQLDQAWITFDRLTGGGVRLIVSAHYCPDSHNGPATAAPFLRRLCAYADRYLDRLTPIGSGGDLEGVMREKGGCGLIPLLENADALLELPPEELRLQGFRVVGLTHAGSNRLADGNGVENPAGLTGAGRNLLAKLERLGFALDTAHLSAPAFREVAERFAGPLVSTHTGLCEFCDTPRNLSRWQAETILSRDGVIGIAVAPELLSPRRRADIGLVFRHIDHLVQRHGPGGVGIGSDFGGFDLVCDGLEDHSRLPALAGMMEAAGYPAEAVAGIMGGNWLRFFSRLYPPS